jgi:uncharacterized membrane protein
MPYMMIAKTGLVTSGVGVALLAQVSPLEAGNKLGEMTALSIMGVCLVTLCFAIVMLYREKDRVKIEALLERCATAMEAVKTSADINTKIMVEVKDVINKCKGHV